MANYTWTSGAQQGGCPGPENYIAPGWYLSGQKLPGITPITSSYKNPATGKPYTPTELASLSGGGGTVGGTTTPGIAGTAYNAGVPTTEANLGSAAYTSLAGIENPTPEQLAAAGFGAKPTPTTAPPVGHPAYNPLIFCAG